MHSSVNRIASAYAPEYVARFVGDPPALATIRAAGRLLAEQTAHRRGPASADACSRLRLQLAAGGVADVAEFLAQLGDSASVDDLVAQGDTATGWRYDAGAECAVALSQIADRLYRLGLPPASPTLERFERRLRERVALEAAAVGAEPPEPPPVPLPPATDRAQLALSDVAAAVRTGSGMTGTYLALHPFSPILEPYEMCCSFKVAGDPG